MSKIKKILQSIAILTVLFGLVNGCYYIKIKYLNQKAIAKNKNQNIVTIFDGDSKQTITIKDSTVKDVLKKAKIKVKPSDIIEPGLDYKINSDIYINIYRANPITIIYGDQKINILTPYKQADQILKQAKIKYYPEDKSKIEINNLTPSEGIGVELIIERAKTLNLSLYGNNNVFRTQSNTVGEFLKEKNIKISKLDKVNYKKTDKIIEGMNLEIWQEGEQRKTIEEIIEFTSRKIYNYDKPSGYKNIKVQGQVGKKIVTYKVNIKNKQEISREEINSVVVKEPVQEIIEIGVKGMFNAPSENENIVWDYLIKQGFTREQTAGIMGNLMQEHKFSTTDVPSGLGIVQWIGSRRSNLINKYPNSYLSIYSQLEYMMFELNANGLANKIKQTKTVKDSLIIFQNQFERCGICRQDLRMKYAMNILASH